MANEAWTSDILGYKRIQINGEDLPRRSTLNLLGGSAEDNPTNGSTDVSGFGGGGGAGARWIFGTSAPSDGVGANGDGYMNTLTGQVYQKVSGTWVIQGTLLGPPGSAGSGALWRTGSGAPSNGLGADGDLYLNVSTGDYYQKAAGSYGSPKGNLTGPSGQAGTPGTPGTSGSILRTGTGVPANTLGANGDYYLDVSTGNLYLKSSNAYGSPVGNLRGPQGIPGTNGSGTPGTIFRVGTTVPSNSLGIDGDLYLNTTTSTIYQRQAGVYNSVGVLTAATAAVNVSLTPTGVVTGTNVQIGIQQLAAGKANLAGGNAFTGAQNFSGGSLRVTDTSNISTSGGRIYTGATAPTGNFKLATDGDLLASGGLFAGSVAVNSLSSNGAVSALGIVQGASFRFYSTATINRIVDMSTGIVVNGLAGAWAMVTQFSWQSQSTTPTVLAFFLQDSLHDGATFSRVRVRIKPATARTTGKMASQIYRIDRSGNVTTIGTQQSDDGTTNTQDLIVPVSGTEIVDTATYQYVAVITSGITANHDLVYGVDVQYTMTTFTP